MQIYFVLMNTKMKKLIFYLPPLGGLGRGQLRHKKAPGSWRTIGG